MNPSLRGQGPRRHPRDRMNHNANERLRRNLLNAQFDTLANLLPIPWNNHGRPTKRYIIEAALQWIEDIQYREFQYMEQVRHLQIENARLANEI
ncbi:hypothetical protein BDA99DRAFT_28214 [Phascolomyces articulosus]|uniref:BHLH domain-containing protein n=1 Tax=Phascolomyces articulosus TaxID=60185 RepID=A0AAD5KH64_9FUNG|nr:hypothetical protein BDA99DRAFT_28214 [Phascolomyces articulosus]